jgi:hypothetical protein
MLLQEKCRQLLAQKTGHVFTLRKRHQPILIRFPEHPLERLASVL